MADQRQLKLLGWGFALVCALSMSADARSDRADWNDLPGAILAHPWVLRNGDVIFRRGVGTRAWAVLMAERDMQFSHVGVVVRNGQSVWVVHAVPGEAPGEHDATKLEPLAIFLSPGRATRAAVYRWSGRAGQEQVPPGDKVARIVMDYARRAVPFDARFDGSSPDALYCTELVVRAYVQAGADLEVHATAMDVVGRHWNVLMPRDLLHSRRLRRVAPDYREGPQA